MNRVGRAALQARIFAVFIRFRLYSDAAATGWGWAIDDLVIQDAALGLPPGEESDPRRDLPSRVVLEQNVPNPFNPSTRIDFELKKHTFEAAADIASVKLWADCQPL